MLHSESKIKINKNIGLNPLDLSLRSEFKTRVIRIFKSIKWFCVFQRIKIQENYPPPPRRYSGPRTRVMTRYSTGVKNAISLSSYRRSHRRGTSLEILSRDQTASRRNGRVVRQNPNVVHQQRDVAAHLRGRYCVRSIIR